MNVTLARHAGLAPADREMDALAPTKSADARNFNLGCPRGCQQSRSLTWRNGNHQFVVIATAQYIRPERWIGAERPPRSRRQRHSLALDVHGKPRRIGDVARIGKQAIGDVG